MKNFRKSYLSVIMASIFLFVSCNQYDDAFSPVEDTSFGNVEKQSLEFTVRTHIKLTKELSSFYEKQNINISSLIVEGESFYKSKNDFRNFLAKNNFKNVDEITLLSKEIGDNLNNFFLSKNLNPTNKNQVADLLSKEIIRQNNNNNNNNNNFSKIFSCEDILNASIENCDENYYISVGLVVLSGFITFGWGTVIGYGGANIIMIKCYNDAGAAYRDCIDNL